MDAKKLLEQFADHLAPKLDTYEQAIYLYALRHSRLQGLEEVVIGFKSARRKMAFGVGEKGKPMSEGTCYDKLRSLAEKGCLQVVESERAGTRIRVLLPSEIPGVVPEQILGDPPGIDELDFFEVAANRVAILERESRQCFYCRRVLTDDNHVIEHVESRPAGTNAYWNVVAACRQCNNRKGALSAEDHLRSLLREGVLSDDEFAARRQALHDLAARALRPILAPNGA